MSGTDIGLHWFRKGLRLHDNLALLDCCKRQAILPVFCLDPHFANEQVVGSNRYSFLLDSLKDLDESLRSRGSRLIVLRGNPSDCLVNFALKHGVTHATFESDIEPYALRRDSEISRCFKESKISVATFETHTLHSKDAYEQYCQRNRLPIPSTYASFCKLFESMGRPRLDVDIPDIIPPLPTSALLTDTQYDVPTLADMGYVNLRNLGADKFPGGETEALRRLHNTVTSDARADWVRKFEKPLTAPNSLSPSTTVGTI